MTLCPLPPQPADVAWPTREWPTGELASTVDKTRLNSLLDQALDETSAGNLGETFAVAAVQAGRLVLERYGPGWGIGQTLPSWSMAKSITHALVGIAVGDGLIDIHAPVAVGEWSGEDDPRRAITLDQMLRMSGGLAFIENYVPDHPSDVIEMLWGAGKADVAHFAAQMPLEHGPGSFWSYSSGTTNLISRCLSGALGLRGDDLAAWMRRRLFEPLGMTSPIPKFDKAGTFIGSSFCFCTARDFARFGLLYLRDGVWDGQRLLPPGWVDYARTATPQQPPNDQEPYGAHWWLDTLGGPGSFAASGFEGQFIIVVPAADLVVIRNGRTPLIGGPDIKAWVHEVASCFR
jgi:CubicO group peptidase (beta-lactamase class C family)